MQSSPDKTVSIRQVRARKFLEALRDHTRFIAFVQEDDQLVVYTCGISPEEWENADIARTMNVLSDLLEE